MRWFLLALLACAALAQPMKPPPGSVVNWDHPLARGLVGCWLLSEGAGSLTRDIVSGNINTLLLTGGKWEGSRGLRMVNSADYVDLGLKTYLTSGKPFSVSWWECPTDDAVAAPRRFSLAVSGGTYFTLVRINATLAAYQNVAWYPSTSSGTGVRSTAAPAVASSIGKWSHWVLTGSDPTSRTTTDYSLYVNGVNCATSEASIADAAQPTNRIGNTSASFQPDAILDNFRIYNRRLSQREAMTLYAEPFAGIYKP